MLAGRQSLANLLGARIRQREQSHRIDRPVAKDRLGIVVDRRVGNLLSSQTAGWAADVIDGGDIPKLVFQHGGNEFSPHPAVPQNPNPELSWHVRRLFV